ncbi:MAG: endopeptidase La [Provencibacterium sp.]|jgi:ATP-dependent Lon protease|nr:endopeptidase La [Provencibacterium sp.]
MSEKVKVKISEKTGRSDKNAPEPIELPVIAMRGIVLFPRMILHFDVARAASIRALNAAVQGDRKIFMVAQRETENEEIQADMLYSVGVVASVKQILKPQDDVLRVVVEGEYRAKLLEMTSTDPYLRARCQEYPVRLPRRGNSILCEALIRTVKDYFEEYCMLSPKMPREFVMGVFMSDDPMYIAEYIAGNIPMPVEQKQAILEQNSPTRRMEQLAAILENENQILSAEQEIQEKVREKIDKNQREYYLREQMKAIAEELDEDENPENEVEEYLQKIAKLGLDDECREKLEKEARRLYKMPPSSHEAGVVRGYLDTCLELPWNKKTKDKLDVAKARAQLDRDHYGMKKVKERITELIAVRSLAPDIKGQIICLYGPPGVGKTSVARSIAKAMGRKYARLSLGGVRDESDIRGHRKTYVGSMPGRVMNAIKLAGSQNPLILLDEIDKLGSDFRGDPSSALLEVLDAEQNLAFRDHFIELPFDLSDVLFIATANDLSTIPAPLLDRMEVIELSSYTREEKYQIARKHLIRKQMHRHGIKATQLTLKKDAVYTLIDNYTREAGVRSLEREIASVMRKCASKIASGECEKISVDAAKITELLGTAKYKPDALDSFDQAGVVNGLAWTSVGGELLQVEVSVLKGTGKLELTGSLGDVMKESAQTAVSVVRRIGEQYGIDPDFHKNCDIHIHFPEGAVPKDGPSAGITIVTALISALSDTKVRHDVAMTGEITLRGRVLPIGGLREKTMAAYRYQMKTVIIPKQNEPDIEEMEQVVREALEIKPVSLIEQVLEIALCERKKPSPVQHAKEAPLLPPPALSGSETACPLPQ